MLDGGGQSQDFVPMGADMLDVKRAANHGLQRVIGGVTLIEIK